MKNNEKIYDDQISPLMKQVINICKKEGIPFFAEFQYSKTDFAKTSIPAMDQHCIMDIIHALSQCIEGTGVNADKFFIYLSRTYPNKSSIVMKMLGNDPNQE